MQKIPRELIRRADQLTVREALYMLYFYRENKSRSRKQIVTELRDIGIPIKFETLKRKTKRMREEGLMTYAELGREEGKGGLKPRAYRLSERGQIEADETIRSLLKKVKI
jgi:hypothetical protein